MGVLGHEFAHIDDYIHRNFLGILARGFSYCSGKSKARFEKEIDKRTIAAGLGENLYTWSYFVFNNSGATKKYLAFKKRIYLSPEEIKLQLNEKAK